MLESAICVILGALAKANRRVVAFRAFSFGRPGNVPVVPPQEGAWQASSGMGIDPVENSCAGAQHHVVLAAKVIGKASARIEFRLGAIQHVRGKSLKLVSQAKVHAQIAAGLPGVLEIQPAVIVRRLSLRLIADGAAEFFVPGKRRD